MSRHSSDGASEPVPLNTAGLRLAALMGQARGLGTKAIARRFFGPTSLVLLLALFQFVLWGLKTVWGFASSQFAKVLPALLIFAAVARRAPRVSSPLGPYAEAVELSRFLTVVGFGPLVLTVVVAALCGAHLLVGWGTTFHVLLTLWLVAARPFAIDVKPRALVAAVGASVLWQGLLWAVVATHGGRVPNLNPTPHLVAAPTPVGLSEAIRTEWSRHCAAPLRYVLTDGHTGASLAVGYRGQPRVIDAMREESAKFFPVDVRVADGAMVVMQRRPDASAPFAAPQPVDWLMADAVWQTTVDLPASDGKRHAYTLGILMPSIGMGCEYAESSGR